MSPSQLIALHGFLGLPQDWRPLADQFLNQDGKPLAWRCRNLWQDAELLQKESFFSADPNEISPAEPRPNDLAFKAWRRLFLADVAKLELREKPVLLGYSLGGRLAMQAAIERPELFSALVVVSAHPGLGENQQTLRLEREKNDAAWAERFLHEPWAELMQAWSAQAVFARAVSRAQNELAPRQEAQFKRESLAWALRMWSLAKQHDLRAQLQRLAIPVLFLSGAEDVKFTELLAASQRSHPSSQISHQAISQAGHRLPWEAPVEFCQALRAFLAKL